MSYPSEVGWSLACFAHPGVVCGGNCLQLVRTHKVSAMLRGHFQRELFPCIYFQYVSEIDACMAQAGKSSLRIAARTGQPFHGDVARRIQRGSRHTAGNTDQQYQTARTNTCGNKNDYEVMTMCRTARRTDGVFDSDN